MHQYGIGADALTVLRSSPGCETSRDDIVHGGKDADYRPLPAGSPNKAACAAMACAPYSMAQMAAQAGAVAQRVVDPTMTGRRTDNVAVVPALDGVEQAHRPLMGNQFGNVQTKSYPRLHDRFDTKSPGFCRLEIIK